MASGNLGIFYRKQEQLQLEHNEMGRRFREGELSEAEWHVYKLDEFRPKQAEIQSAIAELRAAILKRVGSPLQSIDSERVFYPTNADTDLKKMHYILRLQRKLLVAGRRNSDTSLEDDVANEYVGLKRRLRTG